MSSPLVSVNLTTYNRAHILRRALDSVLAQSYENLEIVVVDDCSTDNTADVLAVYQKVDSRLRYFRHHVNKGNAGTRNTALNECKGEFVAFMDDDDEWIDPQKLEKQVAVLQGNPALGIVCTGVRRFNAPHETVDITIPRPDNLAATILRKNGIIYNSSVMTRRALILEMGGFDENMTKGIDSEFFRRCIVKYGYDVHFMADITTAVHEYGTDRMTTRQGPEALVQMMKNQIHLLSKYRLAFLLHPRAAAYRIRKLIIGSTKLAALAVRRCFTPIRWRVVLWARSIREYLQRFRQWHINRARRQPYVIYLTGMPRTGTSYMKNYLGDFAGLSIQRFEPRGFYIAWTRALKADNEILVDKSTHYIRHLSKLERTCGSYAAYSIIVRDPRDQLTSLFDFDRHPELPRNKRFWNYWYKHYQNALLFARSNPGLRVLLIRYEDLVRYPVDVKQYFLTWVGLMVKKENLTDSYSVAYRDDIQDDKVRKKTSASIESIGSYRRIHDRKRREIIDHYRSLPEVMKLMNQLGYHESGLSDRLDPVSDVNMYVPLTDRSRSTSGGADSDPKPSSSQKTL